MARAKALWRGVVTNTLASQPIWAPFTFIGHLKREPDRPIRMEITDKRVAKIIAMALARWAGHDFDGERPPSIGPDKQVTRDQLTPGTVVFRWTDTVDERTVEADMPCDSESHFVQLVIGQPIDHLVLCPTCRIAYEVDLIKESDGGYAARFIVAQNRFVAASRRGLREIQRRGRR